ncbi:hypothetical protein [Gordonia metallireducens]|uniref:hypothetical protein n=1 Tax=Gordonia metallireducens TaxID=2897779 RepID=UPI001E299597|nr:hypothetical protein [Gordonia metallireducens]
MKTDMAVETDTDATDAIVADQDDTTSTTVDDKSTETESETKAGKESPKSTTTSTGKKSAKGAEATTDDDSAETEPSTGDGGRPVGRTPARFGWGAAGVGLLAVITIAASALAIVFGLQLKNRIDIENAGQEALRTAENYAVALTSIDTRNLDRDFARVLEGATGEFKDMYSSSSSQLRQLLVDNQATGKGTVIDAGIKSQSENKVEVMLFVDQTVTNTASPDPRLDRSRILMTMEKVDGRWLASKVELP